MKYIVTINDKSYEVEVEHGKANIVKTTLATAAAHLHKVSATGAVIPVSGNTTACSDTASVSANSASTTQTPSDPSSQTQSAQVQATQTTTNATSGNTANIVGEPVKAPMPGVILQLKVSKGSQVKKGDILLILEAMKMENEIIAPHDGVVSEIIAATGASVSTGDVLLTLS